MPGAGAVYWRFTPAVDAVPKILLQSYSLSPFCFLFIKFGFLFRIFSFAPIFTIDLNKFAFFSPFSLFIAEFFKRKNASLLRCLRFPWNLLLKELKKLFRCRYVNIRFDTIAECLTENLCIIQYFTRKTRKFSYWNLLTWTKIAHWQCIICKFYYYITAFCLI